MAGLACSILCLQKRLQHSDARPLAFGGRFDSVVPIPPALFLGRNTHFFALASASEERWNCVTGENARSGRSMEDVKVQQKGKHVQ